MFNTIEEAIADIKAGKMIIVADDESRENEGDLVMAADFCRPEDINYMITKARGLVCVPISCAQALRLGLEPMVEHTTDAHCTAFTVSVDKLHGTTTGISAAERATTARALADEGTWGSGRLTGHIDLFGLLRSVLSKRKEEDPDFSAEKNELAAHIAAEKKNLAYFAEIETARLHELTKKLEGAMIAVEALGR